MIKAHGGQLIEIEEKEVKNIDKEVNVPNSIKYDLELLFNGGFSPLNTFMNKDDAISVIEEMKLSNGVLWPIPVLLPIKDNVKIGETIKLVSNEEELAILEVEEVFLLDLENYVSKVYGTKEEKHPGVKKVLSEGSIFVTGKLIKKLFDLEIEGISKKKTLTPKEMREYIKDKEWKKVVAFQTRNPIHRAHEYITKVALETNDGLIIHPLVGETKSDDIPADIRAKCYEKLINTYYNTNKTALAYLPAAMRYAGPKEAILHMIIRKNYGFTHMIIGRDHAGVGDYYGTYEAQELVEKYKEELEIKPMKFEHAFFCKECETVITRKTCPHDNTNHIILSGTKVRSMLAEGIKPPKEFSRPEIAEILIDFYQTKNS
jgi:sulfate adenylyltransferase